MNIALWTVKVLWGVFFSLTGFGKVLCYKPALWNQALQEVPDGIKNCDAERERHKKESDQKDVQEKKRHEEEDRLEER